MGSRQPGCSAGAGGATAGAGWPHFLVIGAPRSGTTTLHEVLDTAPSVCMSKVKEPRYFNRSIDFSSHFTGAVTETDRYLSLWDHCPETGIRGEVTPTYFHDPACPLAVRESLPSVKLVAILRHPVDRAISHFNFKERRTGRSAIELCAAIDAAEASRPGDYEHGYLLEPGFYGRHLGRWLEYFDAAQIRILLFERLVADFQGEMQELFRFIGAPVQEAAVLVDARRNPASAPRTRFAGRLMQARALKQLARFVRAERLAVALANKLLIRRAEYAPAAAADRERLFGIYRDDIEQFEELSSLKTGWLGS